MVLFGISNLLRYLLEFLTYCGTVGLLIDLRFSGEIIPKLNRTELEEAEEKSFFKRNAFT